MIRFLRSVLLSPEYTVQERFFNLTGMVGSVATFMVLLINILTRQSPWIIVAMALSLLVFICLTTIMIRTRNYRVIGPAAVFFSIVVIQPLGFFFGGGVYSGAPMWLLIYYIMSFLMMRGRMLVAFVALTVVVSGAVTYISALHPEYVTPLIGDYAIYKDSYLSLVFLGLLFGMLIKLQSILLERESQIARKQRDEIEKLNVAQSRFFASMSHEIRTPINTIIGLNELTLREQSLPAEIVENATGVQNASKMLLSLINDILDLSRIQSGSMEVVEAQYETTAMLSEIVNLLWNRAREKGLRFDIHVGDSIPSMLYGDEMRVKQVIVNLLTNAIKYTSDGSVRLNVGGRKTEANRFLLQIDVEDTGIGIRKEAIPYLFDNFRRIEDVEVRAIEGTGLGLSIAKQLVELMDGMITVDSIYTKGSTFHVEIPQRIVNETPLRYNDISGASAERPVYRQSFEAPEARILIVDDNEMNRVVAGKLLRGTLVHVDLAASGAECLEKTAVNRYDVIFMDHEMPEMDGVETLEKIRSQQNGLCREVPVVALTANAGSDRMRFYTERGFQAYLAKPIHASLLEATLLQLLPASLVDRTEKDPEQQSLVVGRSVRKKPVIVTADCVCDLPDELLQTYGIRLMPFYIVTDEGRFRDLSEIDADNLLQYIADDSKKIRTEPSDVLEYEAFFASCLTEAEHVIHLSLGSAFDKAYTCATHAAESFGNVHVVDSGQLSAGLGMIAAHAARLVKEGKSVQHILDRLPAYAERVRMTFLVPDPKTMLQNRFASRFVGVLVRLFDLEPVFSVRRGKIRLKSLRAGYLESVADQFIKRMLREQRDMDNDLLLMVFSGCSLQERENTLKKMREGGRFNNILVQKASATISANCGLHSFGMAYVKKGAE